MGRESPNKSRRVGDVQGLCTEGTNIFQPLAHLELGSQQVSGVVRSRVRKLLAPSPYLIEGGLWVLFTLFQRRTSAHFEHKIK